MERGPLVAAIEVAAVFFVAFWLPIIAAAKEWL